ncbi:MAG: hypothetical protein JO211_13275, partial [Acidobacteriaceae bacterium]|nr:hypothetical protein [Acidobacteriaceae bacterium]
MLPLFACTLQAQSFTNGQAARAVIGQEEFTFGAEGASQTLVGGVSGLAYANHRLFVADSNIIGATPLNNRVLIFDTTQIPAPHADLTQFPTNDPFCQLCGYSAVDVLGQADYTDISPGRSNQPTPTSGSTAGVGSLNSPTAVASDGNILAVADTNNNRILIWNSIPTSIGQPATLVLGAGNFTDLAPAAATQNNFRGPQGVWIQNGKLFVADTQNFRVLIWNSIPTHNNQPADLVLGQTTFNSGSSGTCDPLASSHTTTASQLCNPVGVSSDGTRLFVADLASNRVLIWNSIPTSNNQPADVVIGQPDTVSAIANNSAVCGGGSECAASLDFPRFALSDGTHLYVADGGNDRVLIFNSIPTQNGASANAVLGQPDFTSDVDSSTNTTTSIASTAIDNTGSVDTIPSPMSLAWDGANLYVSDPFNRRVLVFTPADTSLPDNSVVNWASQIIRQEGIVTISLPATTGAIVANDTVSISIGQAGLSSNPTAYTYTIQSKDTLDGIAQALVSKINANGGDPNVTALFAGAGTASVYLSSKAVDLGFDTISLSATTSNSADITATASGGYLTSGTAATGSPGMLVVINGTNLSGNSATAPTSSAVPTSLGGVQVFMDGYSTPIFSVSPTQIVAQIPYSYTNNTGSSSSTTNITSFDRNSTSIYVRTVHNDGSVTITNATPVYIAPANPGLFSTAPGQPIAPVAGALHQSGNPTAVVSIDGSVHA